jgi:protein tyrosine/serine phosphatase
MKNRTKLSIAFGMAFSVAGALGGYAVYLQVVGNFHTVIEGQLYRSAQPTPSQLDTYVKEHGIKTIINLRGEKQNAAWYQAEIQTAQELGVEHVDFGMSASKKLALTRADEIVAIMAAAPKPILIHCQSGSDRTGLISAIYTSRIAGEGESKAEGQLSFYYGHVAIPLISAAWPMDVSWEDLEEHFEQKG